MKEIRITKNEENQRLDKFLLKYMNKASKGFLYKMLRKKRIKYNGGRAEGSELLKAGDTLQLYLAEETISSFMEEKTVAEAKRHFAIVYEDDDILVVSKPAGLLTHPEKSSDKDTLIDQILYYLYQKGQYLPEADSSFTPALCNRLDRNTSGIVIAGKTLKGVQAVNETIRSHKLDKYYLTLVAGEIREAGEITAYLTKDEEKKQVRISKREGSGKKTMTKYRPLACAKGYTLLEIHLITGKTHQIRAHMQSIGHPVVGDRKYGSEHSNQKFREEYALSNQFLHAIRVEWKEKDGPLGYLYGKEMTAPLPKTLQEICDGLFGKDG
ncbi:MAG: RluA family pseudouridine synthase [Bacteroidales bacterium]|nr:RluA family pseudouridine synthase [Anaerotignum sp.]MCI5679040.1 RluA family pseudouridine synthase [Bacteroidales bacterium]MDY3927591.1 RluA family pseudouridine synthase [Anaerotignum sp.]